MPDLPRPVLRESLVERARARLVERLDAAPARRRVSSESASPAPTSVSSVSIESESSEAGESTALRTDDFDLPLMPESSVQAPMGLAERPVLAVVAVAVLTALLMLGGGWSFQAFTNWQQRSSVAAEDLLPIVEPVAPQPTVEAGAGLPDGASAGPGDEAAASGILTEVTVHVAGAVERPGVVTLAAGSRVVDAVDLAGGPIADADLDRLNLAAPIDDGERIHVPAEGQPSPPVANPQHASADAAAAGPGPIDLNTATSAALESLSGVGPATAAAILDHRDRNGPFFVVDDLLDVPGIGPAKLEALRSQVVVG